MPLNEENAARYKTLLRGYKVGFICMDCPIMFNTLPFVANIEKHNIEEHSGN